MVIRGEWKKNMETTIAYGGYTGIMEKKMEATDLLKKGTNRIRRSGATGLSKQPAKNISPEPSQQIT